MNIFTKTMIFIVKGDYNLVFRYNVYWCTYFAIGVQTAKSGKCTLRVMLR